MGLFSRKGRRETPEDGAFAVGHEDSDDDVDLDEEASAEPADESPAPDPEVDRSRGPFDLTEVADDVSRVDLGALRVHGTPGMAIRLDLDEASQTVTSASMTLGSSSVQLQAFAAPRTAGIWPDIRSDLAQSLVKAGGAADIVDGPLGREIIGRMPTRGADGRTVFAPARFIGVDGPRWFLRAVVTGQAAADPSTSEPIIDLIRSVVVVRGAEAMAPREALALTVPQDPSSPGEDEAQPDESQGSRPALRPFERGPEITEVH